MAALVNLARFVAQALLAVQNERVFLPTMKRKASALNNVILIEANEVPNAVLDAYASRSPFMARFLSESDRYTTICADQIQLDPWIAWPTLHRGVPDTMHGLLRLGQDTNRADAAFPPIWRILREADVSVGVCGSLFSSSEEDQSGYRFMVPDLFAAHGRVKPAALERFQAFNLAMTRASVRNANGRVAPDAGGAVAGLALKGWLHPMTLARIVGQLTRERLDPRRLSRRRNTQAELYGDVFCTLVEMERPQFATYYTNNVAAAMHRFWSASFGDGSMNSARLNSGWLRAYSDEVFVAMASVERILRRLHATIGKDTTVVLASAIGQEEIPAENRSRFVSIVDPEAFIAAVLDGEEAGPHQLLPTMAPDFTIRFERAEDAKRVCQRLHRFSIGDVAALETLERMQAKEVVGVGTGLAYIRHRYELGAPFNLPITFARSDRNTVHLSLQIDDFTGKAVAEMGNQTLSFTELGLGFVEHEEGVNCTAQHCAEGALVVRRPGGRKLAEHRLVSSLDFVPSLLRHFGVAPPPYLPGRSTIEF